MTRRALPKAGAGRPVLDRRAVLVSAAAAAVGLAGCRSGTDPFPRPTVSGARPQSPRPLPGVVDARRQELQVARYAAAVLHGSGELRTADRQLLARIRDTHDIHAAVLSSDDPLDTRLRRPSRPTSAATGVASPTPSAVPRRPAAAIATLQQLESRLVEEHRARALQSTRSDVQPQRLVLLWASLSTAAALCATACAQRRDPGALVDDHRGPVALPGASTAVRDVVAQCHPMIFGIQAAAAQLSGSAAADASDELSRYRALRDRLSLELTDRGRSVPAARATYRLPVQPTDTPTAMTLISGMEERMLPYLGLWTATAVTVSERRTALETLISTGRRTLDWSPRIAVWAGWPT